MMRFGLKDYRDVSFPHNIVSLYLNRLLLQVAFNVVGIFFVIFLYVEFDHSISTVVAIFTVIHLTYAALAPLSARLLSVAGLKRMMMVALPFAFIAAFSLFFWEKSPLLVLGIYTVAIVLYKTLYWVPYHIDFAQFTDRATRGRQITVFKNVSQIALAVMPAIGGFVIIFFDYDVLFLLSAALFLTAFLPLLFIKNTYETFSFRYGETWKRLVAKENRSLALAYFGDGAQSGITMIIWPIFIFILLGGEYATIGVISTLVLLGLIALRFVVGTIVDRWSRTKTLTIGSILYTSGWLLKVFIETAFQIVLVDIYHKAGNVVNRLSFETSTYDAAADNGHYIDEFTVLKEIALNGGRAIMLVVVGVGIAFLGIKIAFVIGAIMTLLMTLLNRRRPLSIQNVHDRPVLGAPVI